ncbi:unnamed protein product, partial [Brenthis ino]
MSFVCRTSNRVTSDNRDCGSAPSSSMVSYEACVMDTRWLIHYTYNVLPTKFPPRRTISSKLAICAEDIIVHKCARRHKCTLLSLSYSGGTTTRHDQYVLRRRTDGETPPNS